MAGARFRKSFVDGEYLGDCTDIHDMDGEGRLDAALKITSAA